MKALVGFTGFVGSNLCAAEKFDATYNSQNIAKAFGTNPDFLVYAGLRAEKYLANHAPAKDMELILQAEENILRINPKKLVLISTIDVFNVPKDVDENTMIDTKNLQPYGYNRYQFECWVQKNYPDALIVRLPGLFGKNIKKNFIYDFIHRIPFMLTEETMIKLSTQDPELKRFYQLQNNGFYKVQVLADAEKEVLKEKYRKLGFSALNFTDSRSVYQFYPLSRLWDDIQTALDHDIRLVHMATEPISAGELYQYLTGEAFINELSGTVADYDYKTVYDEVFSGEQGYICNKKDILAAIKSFIEKEI